ncbi:MAG: DUF3102 domain-containing protein [Dehalococcoidales bacterium]|nr:DUF3102 domain-containing protein [Dehalococcoidales bacterium]
MVESLHYYIECGQRLKAIKESLAYGQWLPWLERNKEALGFERMTAWRLIEGAESNVSSTIYLDDNEASKMLSKMWGNTNHRTLGTGENDWHTPGKYVSAARSVMRGYCFQFTS